MKKSYTWTAPVLASALLFAALSPVVPVYAANGTAEETIQPTQAELREKYLDKMDLKSKDVLGFYHTSMNGSTDARKHNIKKAIKRINGQKLKQNETFSYNGTVGNSNISEDGWQKAGAIVNGQLVEDYGGGICQVSSTLFNAANEAGMRMVERHGHSKTVGYVPAGMDATVAYGYLDFQFANPFDEKVKIKAKTFDDEHVVIAIIRD